MKKENTSLRLKQLMSVKNMRQIDILNACLPYCEQYSVKMNKSDISQYVSGKVEPNQDKLYILGKALNVTEAWLMGYDVPMERNTVENQNSINNFSSKETSMIKKYRVIDNNGKKVVDTILDREYERAVAPTPVLMAAHNDNADNPEELEKIYEDIMNLKRPEQ